MLNNKVVVVTGGILNNQSEIFLDKYKEKCWNKGMLDKSDLKGILVYLLSDMSKYVNGQNVVADDGFCLWFILY